MRLQLSKTTRRRPSTPTANRWVEAVNNWGQLRRWAYHVCRNPQLLDKEMEYLARAESVRSDLDRHDAFRGGL